MRIARTNTLDLAPQAKAKASAAKAKARTAKVEGKAAKVAIRAWAKAKAKVRAKDILLVLDFSYRCRRPLALRLRRLASLIPIWLMSHVTSATRRGTINLSAPNGLLFDHHLRISTPGNKLRGWASF